MKIRVQDSSVRYRVTLRELEELQKQGRIAAECLTPDGGTWRYAIRLAPDCEASRLAIEPFAITLELTPSDFQELSRPDREGVYVRREWSDSGGEVRRMIAFVEKDRPAATCEKPEMWIYEGHGKGPQITVPISSSSE
ncbi:MAG: hypothetical protein D6691_01885 [Candidatus Hydrogenedentota bacterium]|uniref:Uncharacterized protein n=1 Tax=Sumerlaea chitinivorans TaxID=2250252 RepID=A0A2Z4Y8Z4_SUMC1|nr:hypothetical protein BRCON_2372 [Candidatus Sumerlaea chitinivorans]RMH30056.1 MAG: hypothetical protein D6691_01885 [Candidatus Hydrogenedentota bacterium]GIX43964.1 MAG: hypothetical protein KatS3mg130_0372 [Candidatus Sumerlaea sp.]